MAWLVSVASLLVNSAVIRTEYRWVERGTIAPVAGLAQLASRLYTA
ncbi:hypothetical protein [Streptomyces sp. NPDC058305]